MPTLTDKGLAQGVYCMQHLHQTGPVCWLQGQSRLRSQKSVCRANLASYIAHDLCSISPRLRMAHAACGAEGLARYVGCTQHRADPGHALIAAFSHTGPACWLCGQSGLGLWSGLGLQPGPTHQCLVYESYTALDMSRPLNIWLS